MYNRIMSYFEDELTSTRRRLEEGEFASFKDQVLAARRIAEALTFLTPYSRRDQRARLLTRSGEELIRKLMSVREVIRRKSTSAGRQTLLISQIMAEKEYLQ
ncbi:hypothetical protein [Geobacter sp.]|uniref:hypothetical protein n=1 Tax=Geobacter sp. TaxID=46610 RepID=UPI00262952C7|nr:hypothetical protein [Geobacter sp.]